MFPSTKCENGSSFSLDLGGWDLQEVCNDRAHSVRISIYSTNRDKKNNCVSATLGTYARLSRSAVECYPITNAETAVNYRSLFPVYANSAVFSSALRSSTAKINIPGTLKH